METTRSFHVKFNGFCQFLLEGVLVRFSLTVVNSGNQGGVCVFVGLGCVVVDVFFGGWVVCVYCGFGLRMVVVFRGIVVCPGIVTNYSVPSDCVGFGFPWSTLG